MSADLYDIGRVKIDLLGCSPTILLEIFDFYLHKTVVLNGWYGLVYVSKMAKPCPWINMSPGPPPCLHN
jgi:hypothetical protein